MNDIKFKPKAFFVMTAYNAEKYIEEAIFSILKQSEKKFLFLLRDNGSTDRTSDICKRFAEKDKRIILLRNELNNNLTEDEQKDIDNKVKLCMDMGAEYFAVLDSDDFYHKDFLKTTYELAKKENADMVVCGSDFVDETSKKVIGRRIPPRLTIKYRKLEEDDFINLYGSLRPLWGKLYSSRIYKNYYDAFNTKPSELFNGADTYVVLTLMCQINVFVAIERVLHTYRVRNNSLYHTFLQEQRIKSGHILFQKGVEYASTYGTCSSKIMSFLYSVYFSHINDLIDILVKSEKMSVVDKLNYMTAIMDERLFYEICESNDNVMQVVYDAVESILESASDEDRMKAWKYYAVRYFYYYVEPDNGRQSDALLLSVYCDKINTCGWGKAKWRGISKENFKCLIGMVNKDILPEHDSAKQEMLEAIDNNDLDRAIQKLIFLSEERPLGIDTLYFQIYLFYKFGDFENAIRILSIANVFYGDDEEIVNLAQIVYKCARVANDE